MRLFTIYQFLITPERIASMEPRPIFWELVRQLQTPKNNRRIPKQINEIFTPLKEGKYIIRKSEKVLQCA
jgi:hypothetical protein